MNTQHFALSIIEWLKDAYNQSQDADTRREIIDAIETVSTAIIHTKILDDVESET